MPNKMTVKHDNMAESEFEDLNLAGAQFTNINLSGSCFEDINLSGARFHAINFSDVSFIGVQIGGTLFRYIGPVPGPDGIQARQRAVTFEQGMLCDSVFRKMDMTNVRLEACNIAGMTIDGILVTDLLEAWKK